MSLITFMFGNHTFRCFDDPREALDFNADLWDEEDQSSLQHLELVEVRGIDVILREGGSLSYFSSRIDKAILKLPNSAICSTQLRPNAEPQQEPTP